MDPLESIARLVVFIFQTIVFFVGMAFMGGPILFIGFLFGPVGIGIAIFIIIIMALNLIGNVAMKAEEENK